MSKIEEFLENRIPLYIDENVRIHVVPKNNRKDSLINILQKDGYSWIATTRGYYNEQEQYVMLYTNNFEIPNCYVLLIQAIFAYFPNIKWVGLGCIVGEPGDYWEPILKVTSAYCFNPTDK